MCLFPRLIKNKRYLPNKKNGGIPPVCDDHRKLYVPIGCGVCKECMQQKASAWKIRLNEELKVNKYAYFITLTFSPESIKYIYNTYNLKESNALAGKTIRLFLERWRKKYKKSLRHFLITELGHDNTERIHLHGIFYSNEELNKDEIENIWSYGYIYIGEYCNQRTINYIAKYITKTDLDHKGYVPQIFASPGIGQNYTKRLITQNIHTFRNDQTIEYYRFPNGSKCNLPIYYRNKLFSEEQREQLWVNKLDQNTRYVLGVKIENVDTIEGYEHYKNVLKKAQEKNREAGFGDLTKDWQEKTYNITLRMMKKGKISE